MKKNYLLSAAALSCWRLRVAPMISKTEAIPVVRAIAAKSI